MIQDLVKDANPVAIPTAAYPAPCTYFFRQEHRAVLSAHPHWVNLSCLDALTLHDRSTCILERQVLNLIASDAGRREEAQANLTAKPSFPEAYMHDRPEPKAPAQAQAQAPAPRPKARLEQVLEHSPPCTTATVLSIWESYPELERAGGLVPNTFLAIRGTQLQFRKACEFVAKKMSGGNVIKNPAGMVHGTFKRMAARE